MKAEEVQGEAIPSPSRKLIKIHTKTTNVLKRLK